jgi:thymidylate synthase ThyX
VQLGMTLNARSLEGLLARCAADPLAEVRALGAALAQAAGGLAPSLVKYVDPSPYLKDARARLAEAVAAIGAEPEPEDGGADVDVRLLDTSPDPDNALVAALLYAGGAGPMERCRSQALGLPPNDRRRVVESHLRLLGPHDAVLREYELVTAEFEVVVSAACYAQLKRHRMATLVPLPYHPELGLTVPDSVERAGMGDRLRRLAARASETWRSAGTTAPSAAAYGLLNAQRRRVLVGMNARELYHFSRLREDRHAQWDIRRLAARMLALARERMPLVLALTGGKDMFTERRQELGPGWGEL